MNYKEDNIIFSPMGLELIAGMLLAGANNETKAQLYNLLEINGYDDIDKQFHVQCHNVLNDYRNMHSQGRNATIEVANLVLSSDKLLIPESFEKTLNNQYDAAFGKENFELTQHVKDKINKFVKERTHGTIPEILSAPLDANTVFALMSTIYFKGFWENRMHEGPEKTFYNADKSESKVKMLTMEPITTYYVDTQKFKYKLLEVPYDGNVSMVIYLPHERDGLSNIIENLKLEDDIEVAKGAKKTLIKLYLPKFEYDYEMDLNELLPKVGFNLKTALSGIDSRLRVDQALHKAKIRNDKEGTEASAATVLTAVPYSLIEYNPPPIEINVNHPFGFVIYDKQSESAVMLGTLNKMP